MKKEKVKKKLGLLAIAILLCGIPITISARWGYNYAVLNVWSVDSGKHLDWSGSTAFLSNFNTGVNTWNEYKSGVIRKDTLTTINDITISDASALTGNAVAQTTQHGTGKSISSTIKFHTTKMNSLSTMKKNIVCTHELGHALGLDENNNRGTHLIMYNEINTNTSNTSNNVLSSDDKANYDYMYDNKY